MADGSPLTETLSFTSAPVGTLLRCNSEIVAVEVGPNGRRLVAIRPIASGTRLFTITGRESGTPTRYSVQVTATLHLDQDCARDEHDVVQRYFWRYLDHDCDPSAVIREREVIAIRDIEVGDGVTFDYNTTEYDMASPFQCHCSSAHCVGVVRGARHLTAAQRKRVARWLPAYLR